MKNKLIIGICLLLVIIIGTTLFITMNQDYIDLNFAQLSNNVSFPQIPLFSFTVLALAVFLLLIILQSIIGRNKKDILVRISVFGLSFLVILFLKSINLSLGQLIKNSWMIEQTKNCISQKAVPLLKGLDSQNVQGYFVECSLYERAVSVLVPILIAALVAFLFIWIVGGIKSLLAKSGQTSRVVLFFEGIVWFLVLDLFLTNSYYDAAMLFINIFVYIIVLYFLITADTSPAELNNKAVAVIKKNESEDKAALENEDDSETEEELDNENRTPPRF